MAFVSPASGSWTARRVPTKASTAYAQGEFVYSDGTDIVPAVTTTEDIYGITMEAKASAANTNPINVLVPRSPECTILATVGTGTLTAAMVGRQVDLASSTTVDVSASTEDALIVQKYISATQGEFGINYEKGVKS